MATVNLEWPYGIDMTSVQTLYGQVVSANSQQIIIQAGAYQAIYVGVGFTFDTVAGTVTGGTLTGFQEYNNGTPILSASGLQVAATAVSYYVQNNQDEALFNIALAGNDTINGSPGNDTINAFGGTNYINGGGGTDTEVFSGTASQYSMSRVSQGLLVTGVGATDTLLGIQYLRFTDQTFSVAPANALSVQAALALYNSDNSTRFIQIADSAANLAFALSALEAPVLAGAITSIALTDPGTPTITLSPTLATVYGNVLRLITTPYTLSTAPCFVAGSRILTDTGPVPVEQLRVGQLVRTLDGSCQPIAWLGHRRVACARHPKPEDVMPVRVRAHAFSDGRPARDLWLSPDHAVLMDGALIPVRYLINGATIVQEARTWVTYLHVELARHAILFAEGLETESYLDTGNRGAFANGGKAVCLHPDFAIQTWAAEGCAPLVRSGPALIRARQSLLDRAAAHGFRLTRDNSPYLVVDGTPIWPTLVRGPVHRFRLPAAGEIRIASNSARPSDVTAHASDARRLGVMIAGIAAYIPWEWRTVPLSDIAGGRGFHALEHDGPRSWIWTDGDAHLRLPDDLTQGGVLLLDIEISDVQPAWDTRPTVATATIARV